VKGLDQRRAAYRIAVEIDAGYGIEQAEGRNIMAVCRNGFLTVSAFFVAALVFGCSSSFDCQTGKAKPKEAIVLFDGRDFSHWRHTDGTAVRWKIIDGTMEVGVGQGSIVTGEKFQDFSLHVEFNIPVEPAADDKWGHGNSGVYLQRRYEVQILDSYGRAAGRKDCGALYDFRAPDRNVCKQAGQWQSYDIDFRAARFRQEDGNLRKVENARITVRHNGALIHNDVEFFDKTGAGQAEGPQAGPILLQDHGNSVRFRNIRIIPLKE